MNDDLKCIIYTTFERYNKIERIWCPILHEYVYFGSRGRLHLIYKGNRKKRPSKEQLYKLKLFSMVPSAIRNAIAIKEVRCMSNGIEFFAIIGESRQNKKKLRVIIRKTMNGRYNYHSVMLENK